MLSLKPKLAQKFKKAGQIAGKVAQVVLAAPIKLPGKVVQGARYLALAVGLLEALQAKEEEKQPDE